MKKTASVIAVVLGVAFMSVQAKEALKEGSLDNVTVPSASAKVSGQSAQSANLLPSVDNSMRKFGPGGPGNGPGGPGNGPGGPGYGNGYCVGADRGWEEHFGGHRGQDRDGACRACQSEHEKCRYTCYRQAFVCTVNYMAHAQPGTPQGDPQIEVKRYTSTLRNSEREAMDDAMRQCIYSNYGNQSACKLESCDSRDQETDSGKC